MGTLSEELVRIGLADAPPPPPFRHNGEDYNGYRDPDVIDLHSNALAISKKALYHKPKLPFNFKAHSSKLTYKLEVKKLMDRINKETSTYRALGILKEAGKMMTPLEISDEMGEKYPGAPNAPDSIRTFLNRISQVTPDLVERTEDENNIRTFKYISTIADGDLDTAYAKYMDAASAHVSKVRKDKREKDRVARAALKADEERFGFPIGRGKKAEEAAEALIEKAVAFEEAAQEEFMTNQKMKESIMALEGRMRSLEDTILGKIESLHDAVAFINTLKDVLSEQQKTSQTIVALMKGYICKQKGISEEELAVLRS